MKEKYKILITVAPTNACVSVSTYLMGKYKFYYIYFRIQATVL